MIINRPQKITQYADVYERKPKPKRKMVVQVVSDAQKDGNKSEDDYTDLIKESVKEALQKDNERPVHTSQAQRPPPVQEPL